MYRKYFGLGALGSKKMLSAIFLELPSAHRRLQTLIQRLQIFLSSRSIQKSMNRSCNFPGVRGKEGGEGGRYEIVREGGNGLVVVVF